MIPCPNCTKENPADALFCQYCGASLEQVCDNCGTHNAPDARFCKKCGKALLSQHAHSEISQTAAPRLAEAERRFVTILFCDVVGSTAIGELIDPEEWTEIMNGIFNRLIPQVGRYGGTVARLMGDAVLALFGAPVAHEDDPYRAVLAALDMLAAHKPYRLEVRTKLSRSGIPLHPEDLNLRIGINTGLAVVGEVGSGESLEYTAMGDAVNLAARMEQAAVPGTIQITTDTNIAISALVETERLDPLELKGKRDPVPAFRVLGLKDTVQRPYAFGAASPLIGRNQEMNQLAGALSRLQSGYGQAVCLIGEGGLGKSRLVDELAGMSRELGEGVNWYRTESLSFEGSRPYGMIQRLLQRAAGITMNDSPQEIRVKLGTMLADLTLEDTEQLDRVLLTLFALESSSANGQLEGETFKNELSTALQTLTRAWAAAKPTIIVFEDLHWADAVSGDLIVDLVALAESAPILFVCVFRPHTQSPGWMVRNHLRSTAPNRYQEIVLEPLTDDASINLVENLLDMPNLSPAVSRLIIEKAAGVPYFIEEIVNDLLESGALQGAGGSAGGGEMLSIEDIQLPESLEAVLVSRMDRLDQESRHILQLAAVIGRSFDYRVLKMIAGEQQMLDQALNRLQQIGLLLDSPDSAQGRYIFRHVLAQEAAYNTILLRLRRHFHRQVAEAIEIIYAPNSNEQAPLLAYHYHQAGDDERALNYYGVAAGNAARLYANEEALSHYTNAISIATQLLPDDSCLVPLYRERGILLEITGDFDGARDDHQNALRIARLIDEKMLEWQTLHELGKLWTSRDYDRAGEYFKQALALARELDDPILLARSLNRVGNWNANAEHPQEAIIHHQEALEIIENLDDPAGLANTLDLLGIAHLLAGDVKGARQYYDRAVVIFRELDDRYRLAGSLATRRAGPSYNDLARLQSDAEALESLQSAQEALHLSREIGWRAGESFAYWVLCLSHASLDRYGDAFDDVRRGLQIATEIDHRQWMTGHEFNLGVLYSDLLDGEKAQYHGQRALAMAREHRSQYWTNQAAGVLAKAYLHQGDLAQSRAVLATVLEEDTPLDSHAKRFCWLRRAELALAEGDPTYSLEILQRVVAAIPDLANGLIPALWNLRAGALAELGREREAESLLLEAIEGILASAGGRSQLWQLYRAKGQLYRRMGRLNESEETFNAARRYAQLLAETLSDQAIKQAFLAQAFAQLSAAER